MQLTVALKWSPSYTKCPIQTIDLQCPMQYVRSKEAWPSLDTLHTRLMQKTTPEPEDLLPYRGCPFQTQLRPRLLAQPGRLPTDDDPPI